MEEIKIFSNPQFGEIRTATNKAGEPLFCLSDLCKILDIKNPRDCKSRLNPKGVVTTDTPTSGGIQKMIFITESNFYKTVFQSRKPEAEYFTDWVTSEVLPSIRKTGGYMISKEDDTPETIMARALLMAKDTMDRQRRQLELKEKQLQHQAPIVEYANKVLSSTSGHTPTVIASELNMSAVTLNRMLLKARFLRRTGKRGEYALYANYQGQGYVIEHTYDYERPDGSIGTKISLEYTEKGRMKIREITNRAIIAGVLQRKNGRYFLNYDWEPIKEKV
jgi:prophage antirepressor-like protein